MVGQRVPLVGELAPLEVEGTRQAVVGENEADVTEILAKLKGNDGAAFARSEAEEEMKGDEPVGKSLGSMVNLK